jgi:hypothetical protein
MLSRYRSVWGMILQKAGYHFSGSCSTRPPPATPRRIARVCHGEQVSLAIDQKRSSVFLRRVTGGLAGRDSAPGAILSRARTSILGRAARGRRQDGKPADQNQDSKHRAAPFRTVYAAVTKVGRVKRRTSSGRGPLAYQSENAIVLVNREHLRLPALCRPIPDAAAVTTAVRRKTV